MKLALLIAATLTYGTAIYAALFYFSVNDQGARRGKRIISLLGGVATMTALYEIGRQTGAASSLPMVALLLYAASCAVLVWTLRTVRGEPLGFLGTDRAPKRLQTAGPYQWVRHPFYTSYILGWLAALFAAPGVATLIIFISMTLIYVISSQREERTILTTPLAAQYREYTQRVNAFIPLPRWGR